MKEEFYIAKKLKDDVTIYANFEIYQNYSVLVDVTLDKSKATVLNDFELAQEVRRSLNRNSKSVWGVYSQINTMNGIIAINRSGFRV